MNANLNKIGDELKACEVILNQAEKLVSTKVKDNVLKKSNLRVLTELKQDLNDQLRIVEKNDFVMCVVGREKAGKSTLLNAWLKMDLLPNERERCTYTTTEIRWCEEGDQHFTIDYFSVNEFTNNKKKLQTIIASSSRETDSTTAKSLNSTESLHQRELNDIKKHEKEIKAYLGKKTYTVNFDSYEEIRDEIKSAITHPGQARAIKKLCIWMNIENMDENLVLVDVPGYDSPLMLHKEMTRRLMESADSILFVKQFTAPDLVDCEVEILDIQHNANKYIELKDKITVALTHCDEATSIKDKYDLEEKNARAWKEQGIDQDRLVPVSALVELGKDASKAIKSLKELNDGKTGISELKDAVQK